MTHINSVNPFSLQAFIPNSKTLFNLAIFASTHLAMGYFYNAFDLPFSLIYLQIAVTCYNAILNYLIDKFRYNKEAKTPQEIESTSNRCTMASEVLCPYNGILRSTVSLQTKSFLLPHITVFAKPSHNVVTAECFALNLATAADELTKEGGIWLINTIRHANKQEPKPYSPNYWNVLRVFCNHFIRAISKAAPSIFEREFRPIENANCTLWNNVFSYLYIDLNKHKTFYDFWLRTDVGVRAIGDMAGTAFGDYLKTLSFKPWRHLAVGCYRAACFYVIDASIRSFRESYGIPRYPQEDNFWQYEIPISITSDVLRIISTVIGALYIFKESGKSKVD